VQGEEEGKRRWPTPPRSVSRIQNHGRPGERQRKKRVRRDLKGDVSTANDRSNDLGDSTRRKRKNNKTRTKRNLKEEALTQDTQLQRGAERRVRRGAP